MDFLGVAQLLTRIFVVSVNLPNHVRFLHGRVPPATGFAFPLLLLFSEIMKQQINEKCSIKFHFEFLPKNLAPNWQNPSEALCRVPEVNAHVAWDAAWTWHCLQLARNWKRTPWGSHGFNRNWRWVESLMLITCFRENYGGNGIVMTTFIKLLSEVASRLRNCGFSASGSFRVS